MGVVVLDLQPIVGRHTVMGEAEPAIVDVHTAVSGKVLSRLTHLDPTWLPALKEEEPDLVVPISEVDTLFVHPIVVRE